MKSSPANPDEAVSTDELLVETAARPDGFDVEQIRLDFPVLHQRCTGSPSSISTTPRRRRSRGR
jgi:hypothetical protein